MLPSEISNCPKNEFKKLAVSQVTVPMFEIIGLIASLLKPSPLPSPLCCSLQV